MVGAGTVAADDPELTCRLPGFRPTQVVRVIADSGLRTPLTARLITGAAEAPTWVLTREDADPERRRRFTTAGVWLIETAGDAAGVDLVEGLRHLGTAGLTRVLVEGGAGLAASLLRLGLVDRIAWFHAPGVVGGDGFPAVQAFGVVRLADMPRFRRRSTSPLGDDMLTEFEKVAP